jgi:Xaa-Pro aminopeptidase
MEMATEFELKVARGRRLLQETGQRGLLLHSYANFAWITGGGRNHVSVAADRGVGAVLVTPDAVYLLADNIEAARLREEELPGIPVAVREFPWWSGSMVDEALKLVPGGELLTDFPGAGARALSPAETVALRNPLLPEEIERYRRLGEDVGVVLTHVALHCRPALTEHQLAGMLGKALMDFGIVPSVTLVAADERLYTRRHPLPTARRLERYAMLVVGGRRDGLHVSATRLVHFGPVPAELRERHAACARVDAAFLAATRPGVALSEVFRLGQAAYAAEGYPDEWQQHHQGGPTGYAGRDLKATPDAPGGVLMHQAFAWNPSIAGTKSEDTVLVTESGLEVLSTTPDLPTLKAHAAGTTFPRPAILER